MPFRQADLPNDAPVAVGVRDAPPIRRTIGFVPLRRRVSLAQRRRSVAGLASRRFRSPDPGVDERGCDRRSTSSRGNRHLSGSYLRIEPVMSVAAVITIAVGALPQPTKA